MSMSRKHFRYIARALAMTRPTAEQYTTTSAVGGNVFVNSMAHDYAASQWRRTRDAIASKLAIECDNFDRATFYAATEAQAQAEVSS